MTDKILDLWTNYYTSSSLFPNLYPQPGGGRQYIHVNGYKAQQLMKDGYIIQKKYWKFVILGKPIKIKMPWNLPN
jgi:hypothetical protein